MLTPPIVVWIGFHVFVLLILALDLGVLHRQAHTVSVKEALGWSAVWIALALAFNVGLYVWSDTDTALAFLTGYLIEKSLSVDNIFVFLMIFSYFGVPQQYQHKVLFWGILGALGMRALLIALGATLLQQFHWVIYLFGAFLVITGMKMAVQREGAIHLERNPLVRLCRRLIPVTTVYHGDKFCGQGSGRRVATP